MLLWKCEICRQYLTEHEEGWLAPKPRQNFRQLISCVRASVLSELDPETSPLDSGK